MKRIIFILFISIAVISAYSGDQFSEKESERSILNVLLGRECLCRCGRSPNIPSLFRSARGEALIFTPEEVETAPENLGTILHNADDSSIAEIEEEKLLGGDILPPNSFPWLALVLINGIPVAQGAIITDRHILTAATPLINVVASNVKVQVGAHDRCIVDTFSSNASVELISIHPSFATINKASDLALLRLTSSLRFDARVLPICVPTSNSSFVGQVVSVASWLSPVAPNFFVPIPPPNCLPKVVRLPVLSKDECIRTVTSTALLTPDKSCLGVFGANTVLCAGDIGAPIQFVNRGRYVLLGILPGINACGASNSSLFVRVADHAAWIIQNTLTGCYCHK